MGSERVELSIHTHMSAMDGVDSAGDLLAQAVKHGLSAIAVTDRDGVQAFPEAEKAAAQLNAQGCPVRVLYGMDAGCRDDHSAFRMTVLAQTREGLKNLYRLVTLLHTVHFGENTPCLSKGELAAHRKGLLLGSGGWEGELMQAIVSGQPWERLREIAEFYDYLEIQPFLDQAHNRTVVQLGEALQIPVCATGNVYFCGPEDALCRHILLEARHADEDTPMPFYLRSTEEMLADFAYLGDTTAYRVVLENPGEMAKQIESLHPVPEGIFPPQIDNGQQRLSALVWENAQKRYGDPLPETVQVRLEKELSQIAEHGYAGIYLTTQMVTADSEKRGYRVLSRGCVGASLVAHLAGITEVNPLPPHYVCPRCQYTEFFSDGNLGSGFDLPEKDCPRCGAGLRRDGQEIPAEVFMGQNGEKVPDINLNLTPAYLPAAYELLRSQFGKAHVLRQGAIRTVSPRRAAEYVRRYAKKHALELDEAEIRRLAKRLEGVKCGSRYLPGSWVLLPADSDTEDFTAAEIPEADPKSGCLATHFDFHSLSGLCRQNFLGHRVPAIYRALEDATGIPVTDVPLSDPEVYSLLTSPKALGVTPEEIGCETGTLGLPELESKFVRELLPEVKPNTFSDLMKLSGLAHGTGVWTDNAQALLAKGTCSLADVIAQRDDVMLQLLRKGFPRETAYRIMESVWKGRAHRLSRELWQELLAAGFPEWYPDSCVKIRFLFPKAHSAAYMMAALRLGWYKIHYPAAFYAACLSARLDAAAETDGFDLGVLLKGPEEISRQFAGWEEADDDPSAERKRFYQLAYEAVRRGISFLPADAPSSGFSAENGVVRIPVRRCPQPCPQS